MRDWRYCYAFTVYWWNQSIISTDNITNYYYHYWSQNDWWSTYFGHSQTRTFDSISLFEWQYDNSSLTRDWSAITNSTLSTENVVKNASESIWNSTYNQSLLVDYKEGIEFDTDNDNIFNFGFYTDGRWTNQQIGKYQQAFVIFNLPSNATLQGMDSDSDGLTDHAELYTHYTNPKMADTDEDLREDGDEITLGYDPLFWTSVTTAPVITTPEFEVRTEYNDSPKTDLNISFNYTDADGDNGTAVVVWYQGASTLYSENIIVFNGTIVNATLPAANYYGGYNINATVYAVDYFGGVSNSEYVNQTITQYDPQGATILLDLKPAGNYSDTTWIIEFGLDGGSVPDYSDSCGVIAGAVTEQIEASTIGAKALSYSAEGTSTGWEEKRRFDLVRFPRRLYENTFRIFFEVNETLTQDVVTQVDINVTEVLSRQGSPTVDTDTYRLYRISKDGSIYNDTGLCYEQPVKVG